MKKLLKFLLVAAILGGSALAAKRMLASAKTAEPDTSAAPPPLVTVVVARAETLPARVHATGTVVPARQLVVSAQVGGKIVEQSPRLVVGGRFAAGETLARVDPRDYSLMIRERRSQVERAELELALEQGRAKVAAREWEMLGKDAPAASEGALALRQPQLETAEVAVAAAKGALERAELDHGRTRLVAPFDATVIAENLEVGQVVQPASPLVTLVGTEQVWVRVSLPVDQLDLVRLPDAEDRPGSSVTVVQELGAGARSVHTGVVERLVGELDPQTRLAQLVVSVPHPFDPPSGQLPLLPGAFVTAEIEGRELAGLVAVPRVALVDGDGAWVVDADDALARRELAVVWGDGERVWVRSGITAGERIVVSKVPAIAGMRVRVGGAPATE